MEVRTGFPFNYDADAASAATGLRCIEPTMTQQQFREEVDINTILRRFRLTGEMPSDVRMPTYADFTDVYDFHTAANAVAQAREAFETMPANVRTRFHNDPGEFVDFCSREENRAEAARLGLIPMPKPAETPPAEPAAGGEVTGG